MFLPILSLPTVNNNWRWQLVANDALLAHCYWTPFQAKRSKESEMSLQQCSLSGVE